MIWRARFSKILALVAIANLSVAQTHVISKRQIGVLARTGALPQGKRTTNFALPAATTRLENEIETFDFVIRELRKAEKAAALKMEALIERLVEEQKTGESSMKSEASMPNAADEDTAISQEKRTAEVATGRSGYLVKPSQKPYQQPTDLFDPDDFLAGTQSAFGCSDKTNAKSSYGDTLDNAKTLNLPSVIDILRSGNERAHRKFYTNPYSKRNLASLARDGGLSSLKYPSIRDQDSLWFDDFGSDGDGKAKLRMDLAKRTNSEGDANEPRKLWEQTRVRREPSDLRPWSEVVADSSDPVAAFAEGNLVEKRFLGRIPQLGRTHPKVQAQPIRRRPHLRPNWL